LKVQNLLLIFILVLLFHHANAQYKTYIISIHGDTLNGIDNKGFKQGKWVVHVDPLRGEPGYEEAAKREIGHKV
jgi:hypothetical protein